MTLEQVIPVLQVTLIGLNIVIGVLTIVQSLCNKSDPSDGKSMPNSN